MLLDPSLTAADLHRALSTCSRPTALKPFEGFYYLFFIKWFVIQLMHVGYHSYLIYALVLAFYRCQGATESRQITVIRVSIVWRCLHTSLL